MQFYLALLLASSLNTLYFSVATHQANVLALPEKGKFVSEAKSMQMSQYMCILFAFKIHVT